MRTNDIKLRLELPDDPTGYAYSSDEVFEVHEHEGIFRLALLAKGRPSQAFQIVCLTRAGLERLRDEITKALDK